jgi:hypothetical protein
MDKRLPDPSPSANHHHHKSPTAHSTAQPVNKVSQSAASIQLPRSPSPKTNWQLLHPYGFETTMGFGAALVSGRRAMHLYTQLTACPIARWFHPHNLGALPQYIYTRTQSPATGPYAPPAVPHSQEHHRASYSRTPIDRQGSKIQCD